MTTWRGWDDDEFNKRANALLAILLAVWKDILEQVARAASRESTINSAPALIHSGWTKALDDEVLPYIGDTYVDTTRDVLRDVDDDEVDDLLIGEDLVDSYLRDRRNLLVGIGDDVWESVREQIRQANAEGESVKDIAARIKEVAGVSEERADVIARTEVHAAHESASYEQAKFVDPNATKEWLATNDSRTRPTHREADNQTVKINETFNVGGSLLRFPGDPRGEPSETINCRCSTAYEFDLDSQENEMPLGDTDVEMELVAAGNVWKPHAHPRGKDGRFISKGEISNLLSKSNLNITDVAAGVAELDNKKWDNLTTQQQDYIIKSANSLPEGSDIKKKAKSKITSLILGDHVTNYDSDAPKVDAPKADVPSAPAGASVPAGMKGKPGDPAKFTTGVIWGKHPVGQVIAQRTAEDGGAETLVWNGKKYETYNDGQLTAQYSKKSAYETFKGDSSWKIPGGSDTTSPETTPATVPTATPTAPSVPDSTSTLSMLDVEDDLSNDIDDVPEYGGLTDSDIAEFDDDDDDDDDNLYDPYKEIYGDNSDDDDGASVNVPVPVELHESLAGLDVSSENQIFSDLQKFIPYFDLTSDKDKKDIEQIVESLANAHDTTPHVIADIYDQKLELTTNTKTDHTLKKAISPEVSAPPPASVVPETSTPVIPTAAASNDISNIPQFTQKAWKKQVKANGNVGYWSKPEKLFDAVKQIVKDHPDPNNPGQSLYSPLQVLKALDAQTKSSQPSPHLTKIQNWGKTPAGSAAINDAMSGGVGVSAPSTSVSAPSPTSVSTPTPTSATKVTSSMGTGFTGNAISPPSSSIPSGTPGALPDVSVVDTSDVPDAKKQQVFKELKFQGVTLYTAPTSKYKLIKATADKHNLSLAKTLSILDEISAKNVKKTNTNMHQKQVQQFLQTPQGAAAALGIPVALPDTPPLAVPAFVPSFEESSKFKYKTITISEANTLSAESKKQHGDWTAAQTAGMRAYTGSAYHAINSYLYGQNSSITASRLTQLKNAQKGMRPSTRPMIIKRGVDYNGIGGASSHDDLEKLVGQKWKSGGFFSTSVGEKAAFGSKPVILEVEAPPGTPMAWVKPISQHSNENEMLLAAGLTYQIISVKEDGLKSIVRLRVVPSNDTTKPPGVSSASVTSTSPTTPSASNAPSASTSTTSAPDVTTSVPSTPSTPSSEASASTPSETVPVSPDTPSDTGPMSDPLFKNAVSGSHALYAAPMSTYSDLPPNVNGVSDTDIYQALSDYTAQGYQEINAQLRINKGKANTFSIPANTKKQIKSINALMKDSPLSQNVVVHRGIKNPVAVFGSAWSDDKDMTGLTWTDHGYTSTSTSPDVAKKFTPDTGGVIMNIVVPKGKKAIMMSGENDEQELLLQHSLKYQVIRDNGIIDGKRSIDVEVL